jgi:hypothetical protein
MLIIILNSQQPASDFYTHVPLLSYQQRVGTVAAPLLAGQTAATQASDHAAACSYFPS